MLDGNSARASLRACLLIGWSSTPSSMNTSSLVSLGEADKGQLEALSMLFGVGLVLFEPVANHPSFQINVLAQKFAPDMFYVNEVAERPKEFDADKFEKLFG